jgi:hypothetical protein
MLIWGNKSYSEQLGYIISECPSCGSTGPLSVFQTQKKFTIYFIPTFSYENQQVLQCGACQATFEVPDEMKDHVASTLMSQSELSAAVAQESRRSKAPASSSPGSVAVDDETDWDRRQPEAWQPGLEFSISVVASLTRYVSETTPRSTGRVSGEVSVPEVLGLLIPTDTDLRGDIQKLRSSSAALVARGMVAFELLFLRLWAADCAVYHAIEDEARSEVVRDALWESVRSVVEVDVWQDVADRANRYNDAMARSSSNGSYAQAAGKAFAELATDERLLEAAPKDGRLAGIVDLTRIGCDAFSEVLTSKRDLVESLTVDTESWQRREA